MRSSTPLGGCGGLQARRTEPLLVPERTSRASAVRRSRGRPRSCAIPVSRDAVARRPRDGGSRGVCQRAVDVSARGGSEPETRSRALELARSTTPAYPELSCSAPFGRLRSEQFDAGAFRTDGTPCRCLQLTGMLLAMLACVRPGRAGSRSLMRELGSWEAGDVGHDRDHSQEPWLTVACRREGSAVRVTRVLVSARRSVWLARSRRGLHGHRGPRGVGCVR